MAELARRVNRTAVTAVLALLLVAGLAWAALPGVPRVGVNEADEPELEKTIPITKKGSPRTVLQLDADDLGAVGAGDKVEAFAEVEVSVTCLEPIPKCVGKIYSYSPRVEAQLVLADGDGRNGTRVGNAESLTCAQDLPNRNHHCVLYLHRTETLKNAPNCAPRCSLNVVLAASHRKAKDGNKLVIGADKDTYIQQGKAAISAAVFEPDETYDPRLIKTTERLKKTVPVEREDTREVTVASIRLDDLSEGESLLIEARAVSSIGHLPYNVLSQGQIVISERRASSDNHGIPLSVVSNNGKVATANGFNCTQGASAFSTPCAIQKGGAVRILRNARTHPNQDEGPRVPLWVNFFVGFGEEYTTGRTWRQGDEAKIRSVKLEVRRFLTPAQRP